MTDSPGPAEELRDAARLMRELAAKVPAPWGLIGGTIYPLAEDTWVISNSGVTEWAEYLFSMHPGVALALADWLEATAIGYETLAASIFGAEGASFVAGFEGGDLDPAIRTARAYLGTREK